MHPVGTVPTVKMHPVGTVPTVKMHPIGTVPTIKMHPIGTVPTDKMHPVGTLIFFIYFLKLEFGLYSKNMWPLVASIKLSKSDKQSTKNNPQAIKDALKPLNLSPLWNFSYLGVKCHVPLLQSPVSALIKISELPKGVMSNWEFYGNFAVFFSDTSS